MTDQNISAVIAALAEKAANGAGDPPVLGHEAAEKMQLLSTAAAKDVTLLGNTVMDVATRINMECEDLATTMLDHGQFVARHIMNFAALAKEVGLRNRETRQHITGELSIAQPAQAEMQDEAEQIEADPIEKHGERFERTMA